MAEPSRIELGEGAYLYVRTGSKKGNWQLYAYVAGEEIKTSLGTADAREATRKARAIMGVALARRDAGQSVRPRLFRDVAMAFLSTEEAARRVASVDPARAKEHAARQAKKLRDQRHTVEKHLLPFLTGCDADGTPVEDDSPDRYPRPNPVLTIDGLTTDFMAGYEAWRQERRFALIDDLALKAEERRAAATARWHGNPHIRSHAPDLESYLPKASVGNIGQEVSATAINTEMGVLKLILGYGAARGLIGDAQIPKLPRKKSGAWSRVGFTDKQVVDIRRHARSHFKRARTQVQARFLMEHPEPEETVEEFFAAISAEDPQRTAERLQRRLALQAAIRADRFAHGRFILCCVVDILAGTGMRPSSLTGMTRGDVLIRPRRGAKGDAAKEDILLRVATYKGRGGRKREAEIVPHVRALPAIRNLLEYLPKDPQTKLIDIPAHSLNQNFVRLLDECRKDKAFLDSLEGKPWRSLYDLRHYYITRALREGKEVVWVARNTLTSILMIQDYYLHLTPGEVARQLSGEDDLDSDW